MTFMTQINILQHSWLDQLSQGPYIAYQLGQDKSREDGANSQNESKLLGSGNFEMRMLSKFITTSKKAETNQVI